MFQTNTSLKNNSQVTPSAEVKLSKPATTNEQAFDNFVKQFDGKT